jgi:hypothetical protein
MQAVEGTLVGCTWGLRDAIGGPDALPSVCTAHEHEIEPPLARALHAAATVPLRRQIVDHVDRLESEFDHHGHVVSNFTGRRYS